MREPRHSDNWRKSRKGQWADWIESVILALTALGAIAVGVADATGLIQEAWISDRVPQFTLILLALLALAYLVRQRASPDLDDIREELREIRGGEPLTFDKPEDLYDYVASRIRRAASSIDDITWGSRTAYRTAPEKRAYENYLSAMRDAIKKGTVLYREISNLSELYYYDRIKSLIDHNYLSYNVGYYDSTNVEIPLVSYMVVDRHEVIGWFYRDPTGRAQEREVFVTITEPILVRLFVDYYNTLWDKSTKIKVNANVSTQLLTEIGARLRGANP